VIALWGHCRLPWAGNNRRRTGLGPHPDEFHRHPGLSARARINSESPVAGRGQSAGMPRARALRDFGRASLFREARGVRRIPTLSTLAVDSRCWNSASNSTFVSARRLRPAPTLSHAGQQDGRELGGTQAGRLLWTEVFRRPVQARGASHGFVGSGRTWTLATRGMEDKMARVKRRSGYVPH